MPTRASSLTARGVTVDRGDGPVLADVDVQITDTSRLAVVGPNGVGKSTLFAVLAGVLEPLSGSVETAPGDATVGLLRQEPERPPDATVRAMLGRRLGVTQAQERFDRATAALADERPGTAEEYDRALTAWMRIGAADFDARLERAADDLGLESRLLELAPRALSGGQFARVGLLAVMLSRFDITLLDEPTNDLDTDGLERLERWVLDHDGGIALISHDRAFLERTATDVLEIDEHRRDASLFRGGWQAFLDERARAREHQVRAHAEYETERDRLRARAQQQREWVDRGVRRQQRHAADGDKHRRNFNLAQTERLAGRARATERALERLEPVDAPWDGWELRFTINEAPRSGKVVAALDRAEIRRGDWHIGPVDLEIHWADRVALVGPNGSGKSSLIAALLGRLPLAAGRATLGPSVVVGELGQQRSEIGEGSSSLLDAFVAETGRLTTEARSVLAKFGLDARTVERPAASLSPGERTRARLAAFQATGVNFLILDEPTNHLDLPAVEQLESALAGFDGTLLLVSHDRRLLDAVETTSTIDITAY